MKYGRIILVALPFYILQVLFQTFLVVAEKPQFGLIMTLISGFFTALNDGLTSALISFLRTLVFESAAIMLLPLIFQITGVWFSVVVAESMAFVIGFLLLFVKRKKYNY